MLTNDQLIRLILGFKVRYLRQQKGLSYTELAEKTGLSTSYLNDIEKGKKYPRSEKITALAEAFELDYNDLVSTKASKKLQPVIDLMSSHFFKYFPLHEFGIDAERLLELFTKTPERVNAFISSVFNLARRYQIDEPQFYKVALRSWQDMHDNYFEDIETAVKNFREELNWDASPCQTKDLESALGTVYNIGVNRDELPNRPNMSHIRSYFGAKRRCLYLNQNLGAARENFLIAREIGFQYLKLKERPVVTRIQKMDSFEKLLNNFRASYFAAALLMDETQLVNDFRSIARENTLPTEFLMNILDKYQVTQEMMLQRLTNLLPRHFGLEDLFFIRISGSPDLKRFEMTKELHLSRLHNPYRNELDEHYCRRWLSVNILKRLRTYTQEKAQNGITDIQVSEYWQTENEYLCLSFARPDTLNPKASTSVTLGLLITPQLRAVFNFLNDPKLVKRAVHTTCERCSIPDCEARAITPKVIEMAEEKQKIETELEELD